jgi:hypothetical protein
MKAVINGKLYNTETAKYIGSFSSGIPRNLDAYEESLYRTRKGEFFIAGSGGPYSKYSRSIGQNEIAGGSKITPMTVGEAQKWAEEYLSAEEYIEAFGMPEEA